jgi:Rrf2 family protein
MAGEVAREERIPVNFVRKILESLARTGLVKSFRGAGGGFVLGYPAETITVRMVLEAVEGPLAFNQCLIPDGCDSMATCAMAQVWAEAQRAVETVLDRYTLADIARSRSLHRQACVAE